MSRYDDPDREAFRHGHDYTYPTEASIIRRRTRHRPSSPRQDDVTTEDQTVTPFDR